MRKLFLLLLFIPIVNFANMYPAIVTMNDGTTKKGTIKLPEYPDDNRVKFKSELGDTEKLDIEDVNFFEIINKKNEKVKYVTMKVAEPKGFSFNNFAVRNKKQWLKEIIVNKISIYAGYYMYNPGNKTGGGSIYYLKKEKDDFAYYFTEDSSGGFTVSINDFKNLKKVLSGIFKDDCPKFSDSVVKEEYNKRGFDYLVLLYNQICGN